MTSIFEVKNHLIILDVKNDKFMFEPKNACHMTFIIVNGKLEIVV